MHVLADYRHSALGDAGAESGTGREVEYTGAELWEVELAWATTVHKAQGSESKAVIVVLSPAHRPLLTRRLFYTGEASCPCCCLGRCCAPAPPRAKE